MFSKLTLRKIGNSVGITFPSEVLRRLKLDEGDILYAVETPRGLLLSPTDPTFAETMDAANEIIARDRDALKALAKK